MYQRFIFSNIEYIKKRDISVSFFVFYLGFGLAYSEAVHSCEFELVHHKSFSCIIIFCWGMLFSYSFNAKLWITRLDTNWIINASIGRQIKMIHHVLAFLLLFFTIKMIQIIMQGRPIIINKPQIRFIIDLIVSNVISNCISCKYKLLL